jgi:hypothetical protein
VGVGVDVWMCGCVDVWVCGCVGVCVGVWVLLFFIDCKKKGFHCRYCPAAGPQRSKGRLFFAGIASKRLFAFPLYMRAPRL